MKEKSNIKMILFTLLCLAAFLMIGCSATVTPESPENSPVQSEITYTVNYKSDYGTIPDSLKNGISVKENTVLNESQLPVLTDDNAVFKGWYDGETKALAGEYKVTKNVTLTALWGDKAIVAYSSVFSSVPTSFEAKLNQKLTAENLTALECSPYTFLGWFYSKDKNGNGSGTQAKADDVIKADITLYAKWKTATISFETAHGSAASLIKYSGLKITAAEIPVLEEAGFTFGGWFNGENKLAADYVVKEDAAFTAKWTANSYAVTFDKNASDASGSMDVQNFVFASPASLTANAFARSCYTFLGWALESNANEATYTDGETFSVPAKNITLYAVWKANEYTITFDKNASGAAGTMESQTVTFGKTEKLKANTFIYNGYRLASWNTSADGSGASYSDGGDFAVNEARNITLYAQWVEADRCIITYQNTRGAINSSPTSYRETVGLALSDLSLTGYIFDGWYDSKDFAGNGSGNKITGWGANEKSGDITLYAAWSPATDTAYKVEHYQENADDDGFTLKETENLTGTTDSATSATAKNYENFTAQAFSQNTIAPDGSSLVKIYYKRNLVTMTFNLAGGKIGEETSKTLTGKYGASYTITSPAKIGYTFASWSPALPSKMENGTFTASYTPNTNTAYKVYHYQQNADDDGYSLKDTDNMTGTTAEQTAAAAKAYEHFTAGTVNQTAIAADGSTEIKINYDREKITFTLELDDGSLDGKTGVVTITGKYGQTVIVNSPEKEGYSFEGWNTSGGTIAQVFDADTTYTAKWTAAKGITITVNEADITVTKAQNGSTITFTAEECDSYSWLLDDKVIAASQSCAIDTSTLTRGTYTLALEAEKGGRWYSYFAQIKVTE